MGLTIKGEGTNSLFGEMSGEVNNEVYERLSILDIANEELLDYVETTSQANGYPSNLKYVLTGFNHWEHLQDVLNKYPYLEAIELHKKDGWQLWARKGWVNAPFHNDASDYGDNYKAFYSWLSEEDYFNEEIKPCLENFDSLEDLKEFLKTQEDILDEIVRASDDEVVIVNEGRYFETIKKESLDFYHDTNSYLIGLIVKE